MYKVIYKYRVLVFERYVIFTSKKDVENLMKETKIFLYKVQILGHSVLCSRNFLEMTTATDSYVDYSAAPLFPA